MSILPASLRVVLFFAFYACRTSQAPETIVSDGAAVATTTVLGGVSNADNGVVIPIAPLSGGLVMATTEYPSASSAPVTAPPATAAPPAAAAAALAPGNPNPDCQQCSIYFQYVNVYYWPTENTNNTACLSGVTDQPATALPSGLTPVSPSAYLVFPTISAGNACTRVGNIYYSQTMPFAPGALHTMVGTSGVAQPFNFADLPCPPPAVASADSWFYNPSYNPGRAYSPMVSPPPEVFALDPAFQNCVAAVYQGFDPPYAIPPSHGLSGPVGGNRRKRSGPAHLVPKGPVQTPAPRL